MTKSDNLSQEGVGAKEMNHSCLSGHLDEEEQAGSTVLDKFIKKSAESFIYFSCLMEHILSVDAKIFIPFKRMIVAPPSLGPLTSCFKKFWRRIKCLPEHIGVGGLAVSFPK